MAIKKAVGRPQEFNFRIVNKLADSISNNYPISDSCKFARISKNTYYRYLKSEPMFREKMAQAHANKNKVNFNFRTIP